MRCGESGDDISSVSRNPIISVTINLYRPRGMKPRGINFIKNLQIYLLYVKKFNKIKSDLKIQLEETCYEKNYNSS